MKKLIALFLLTLATAASAQPCCYHHHYHWAGPGLGLVPLTAGVVIGAELASQPRTVIVEQQPVYIQQPQTVVQLPPAGYHWAEMFDPQTNTKRIVLVPNQ